VQTSAAAPSRGGVRRADAGDAEPVAALWSELSAHHARLDARHALRPDAQREIGRLVRAELGDPDALILLYEQQGRACGLCMTRIQHAPPIHRETRRAEIGELFVRSEARRRGVGRALVGEALAWLRERDVARVVVRVDSGNELGQTFWRGIGFADSMDVLERRL
jgi:ribosomal protein S18 acetylase RimI-like enzyme